MSMADFCSLLFYGEEYECGICGGHSLGSDRPLPYVCNHCRAKALKLQAEKEMKEQRKSASMTAEEKRIRKLANQKRYRDSHREQINRYVRERKQNDPIFKLSCQTRNVVYQSFARTGNVKAEQCEKITGLSQGELIKYLTATYKSTYGKEWDGKEPVHIDHITPLSTAKTDDDVMRLCHYTNLQLLKAEDNLAKSNKLNYHI